MTRLAVLREEQDVLREENCRSSSYNIKAWLLHALCPAKYKSSELFTLIITKSQNLPDVVMMRIRSGGSRPTTQHRSKAGFAGEGTRQNQETEK